MSELLYVSLSDPASSTTTRLWRVPREAAEAGRRRGLHDEGGIYQNEAGAGGVSVLFSCCYCCYCCCCVLFHGFSLCMFALLLLELEWSVESLSQWIPGHFQEDCGDARGVSVSCGCPSCPAQRPEFPRVFRVQPRCKWSDGAFFHSYYFLNCV